MIGHEASAMHFVLDITTGALGDLSFFKKYEQTLILDQSEVQLSYEPATETRNRKLLESNVLGEWELRIGLYRVFYDVDVDGATVKIKAVGYKKHNTLYLRGKEYTL
jgi:mRNA-degrading endonuclease RelE of RelBE toxin-antitoxin system